MILKKIFKLTIVINIIYISILINTNTIYAKITPTEFINNHNIEILEDPYIVSILPNPKGNDLNKTIINIFNPNFDSYNIGNWKIYTSENLYTFPSNYNLNTGINTIYKINNDYIDLKNSVDQIIFETNKNKTIQKIKYYETIEDTYIALNSSTGLFENIHTERSKIPITTDKKSINKEVISENLKSVTEKNPIIETKKLSIPIKNINISQDDKPRELNLIIISILSSILFIFIIFKKKNLFKNLIKLGV